MTPARIAHPKLPNSLKSKQSWFYSPATSLSLLLPFRGTDWKIFETKSWMGGQGVFSMPDPRCVETVELICRRKNQTQCGPGVRMRVCLSQPGQQPVLFSISICRLEAESLMAVQQPRKRKSLERTKHSQASPSFHFYLLNGNKLIIKSIFSVEEQYILMSFSKSRWHFLLYMLADPSWK